MKFVTMALVIAGFFSGAAAAQADPPNNANQATLLLITNKVTFAPLQRIKVQEKVDSALANFLLIQNYNAFKARFTFSAPRPAIATVPRR